MIFGLKENIKMKTISQIVREYDDGKIKKNKIYEIEACDLVRIYKAHQRAINDKVMLEAKIAAYDFSKPERVIYG